MNRPWMPLYIADYLADTAHLTTAEHGAYLLLIMHYWRNEGLPTDDDQLRRITRMGAKQWASSGSHVRALFGDNMRHKRIDYELAQAIEKSRTNSANAKRRHRERTEVADISHPHSHTQSQSQSDIERKIPPAPSAIAPSNGSLTQEAINLSDRVALLLGWQPQDIPPAWCGAAYKVQAWLSEGWAGDLIFASIEKQMTSRTGPPNTIKYFEKGIADFIAEQTAPIPKGTVNGYRGPRPFQDDSRSASRAADRLIEAAERGEFTFGPRPSLLPEGGENPIRLIPKG